MFTIEYVESADPLIELVQTDPGAIFARPQMAYLLFLFGEADGETAEWIRCNLRAMDSLLGPDIAGAIFVKRFEVRAFVRDYWSTWGGGTKIHNGHVDLCDIRPGGSHMLATPMFDHAYKPRGLAHQSMRDLTATTYASDEVARSLGVLGELPCVAFLDAMPGPIRCLRLDAYTLPNALTLIRRTVGGLTSAAGYNDSRRLLKEAHLAGTQIASLRAAMLECELAKRTNVIGLENPLIGQLTAARAALLRGNARRFSHELRQSSLPAEAIESAAERASADAHVLQRISTTISRLCWYADAKWPLSASDSDRLIAVLASHVAEILGPDSPSVDELHVTVVADRLTALARMSDDIAANIWGGLPRIEDLKREVAEAIERAIREPREKHSQLADEVQLVSAKLEQVVRELGSVPRVTDAFDAAIRQVRDGAARAIELEPEMVERLLKAVTCGAVKIVGRDIYIGVNVGAMGPYAKAQGTTFG